LATTAVTILTSTTLAQFIEKKGPDIAATASQSISPGSYDQTLVALAVCAVPVTIALLETDQQTYTAVHNWKRNSKTISAISPLVTQLGEGTTSLGVFGGMFLYGHLASDRSARQAGVIGLESFALSGATTQLLKHLFSRERPTTATRDGGRFQRPFSYFRQYSGKKKGFSNFDAFPSGHTSTAFAAATTFSDLYQKPWVPYVAYGTATAVAISRIMERTHWASDCFVGALIGVFSTKGVEWLHGRMNNVTIMPQGDEDEAGLSLSISF
jgi:membrane-associated phospholipid phosphatase